MLRSPSMRLNPATSARSSSSTSARYRMTFWFRMTLHVARLIRRCKVPGGHCSGQVADLLNELESPADSVLSGARGQQPDQVALGGDELLVQLGEGLEDLGRVPPVLQHMVQVVELATNPLEPVHHAKDEFVVVPELREQGHLCSDVCLRALEVGILEDPELLRLTLAVHVQRDRVRCRGGPAWRGLGRPTAIPRHRGPPSRRTEAWCVS